MDTTLNRLLQAREEQIKARARGDLLAEKTWTEAMDRLLDTQLEEMRYLNAND